MFSLPGWSNLAAFSWDSELVSLGGWLGKRVYKRSKIMVKIYLSLSRSDFRFLGSYLTPSLPVECLWVKNAQWPWTKFLGHHKSVFNILVQITCVFFSPFGPVWLGWTRDNVSSMVVNFFFRTKVSLLKQYTKNILIMLFSKIRVIWGGQNLLRDTQLKY